MRDEAFDVDSKVVCWIWISQTAHVSEYRGYVIIPKKRVQNGARYCIDTNRFMGRYIQHIRSSEDTDRRVDRVEDWIRCCIELSNYEIIFAFIKAKSDVYRS